MSTVVLHWSDAAEAELLNSVDGPVGRLIMELSYRAAAVARSAAPVRAVPGTRRTRAGRNSTARAAGFLKADIRTHLARGSLGGLYGGVNAAADPAIFLEYPASQMDRKYPFLTTALDAITGSF